MNLETDVRNPRPDLQAQMDTLRSEYEQLQQQLRASHTSPQPQTSQVTSINQEVYKVAVRLPPFWADKPAVWFAQAEAQFTIANITADSTKYSYVVSQLDSKYAAEVEDIITHPPADNKYTLLKSELIRRLSLSEEQRIRQLVSEEELGDRKPTQFLRHLRSLSGTSFQENLLRQLWLRRLPPQVQAILAAQSELPIDKVAELADKILEVTPVSAVHTTSYSSDNNNAMNERIDQLALEVASLSKALGQQRYLSRNRSKSRKRADHDRDDKNYRFCWYHFKFAKNAKKCQPPCSFPGNGSSSH